MKPMLPNNPACKRPPYPEWHRARMDARSLNVELIKVGEACVMYCDALR
jgi:hypothetical protein